MTDESLMIDLRTVARLLTVSPRTVERMVEAGEFPRPRKMGKRSNRWPRAEVEAWVAGGRVDQGGTPGVSLRLVTEG